MDLHQETFDVVVVGAGVQDFISYSPRAPNPGESVRGDSFTFGFGGKGANQAVMAARLGAKTAMVGKVGNEIFGKSIVENFRANKVNVDEVGLMDDEITTTAAVIVDASGQNTMAGVLGASRLLSIDDLRKAEPKIAGSKILVATLEVDQEVVLKALKIGKKHGVITIFSPAPKFESLVLSEELYQFSDIICLNEWEAEWLTNVTVNEVEDAERALMWFLDRGAKSVIITLGDKGCVFATEGGPKPIHILAPKVEVVDTTGAGDAFIGALVYFMACHWTLPLEECIRRACRIATITVQYAGTQISYPERGKLPEDLILG